MPSDELVESAIDLYLSALAAPAPLIHEQRFIHTPARMSASRATYTTSKTPPAATRLSHRQPRGVRRSASVRLAPKCRSGSKRRTRSCPDFQREPPPHLPPPTPDPTALQLTTGPAMKLVTTSRPITIASGVHAGLSGAVPPQEPVPSDMLPALARTLAPPKTVVLARSPTPPNIPRTPLARAPPVVTVVHASSPIPLVIPPVLLLPSPSSPADRRRNALRRLAKKGKG
ncbi:hypothetical protein B0H10DRAFT_1959565 [Mycena sp. CBHHK59/15]|nr:hypothetical protein B0H10DRAFT_1959565 [Mycena sp. CBHHK59/15]